MVFLIQLWACSIKENDSSLMMLEPRLTQTIDSLGMQEGEGVLKVGRC